MFGNSIDVSPTFYPHSFFLNIYTSSSLSFKNSHTTFHPHMYKTSTHSNQTKKLSRELNKIIAGVATCETRTTTVIFLEKILFSLFLKRKTRVGLDRCCSKKSGTRDNDAPAGG